MATLNNELADVAVNLSLSIVQVYRRFGGGSGIIWHHNGLIITKALIRGGKCMRCQIQMQRSGTGVEAA